MSCGIRVRTQKPAVGGSLNSAEAGARANETAGDKKTPATFVALLKMFIAITT
jgi:hypothetical protein